MLHGLLKSSPHQGYGLYLRVISRRYSCTVGELSEPPEDMKATRFTFKWEGYSVVRIVNGWVKEPKFFGVSHSCC
jgi:hypothetical protein